MVGMTDNAARAASFIQSELRFVAERHPGPVCVGDHVWVGTAGADMVGVMGCLFHVEQNHRLQNSMTALRAVP